MTGLATSALWRISHGLVGAFALIALSPAAPAQDASKPPSASPPATHDAAPNAAIAADYDRIVAELVEITQIPAPPFAEEARAAWLAQAFRRLGLLDVAIDAEGNVLAIRPGTGQATALVAITAHLDTVFAAETDLAVRREGDRLNAPGIGDDSLGLATLLAWIRAMDANAVETRNPILFIGTVGEEGTGDLRGVRYLFAQGRYKDRIAAFVSVDGAHPGRIVTQAVGSKRYRVAFTGPGGHSFGAYGIVNPMAAMADTVSHLYDIAVPASPRTTYSASVVEGGTSINSIPAEIALQVDMRSVDPGELARLESRFLAIVDQAVAHENFARSTAQGEIAAKKELIGDRPAGGTDGEHPLVLAAERAFRSFGYETSRDASSTDANIAMSLGVPAVTIGSGYRGGRAHSLDEYLDVTREPFVRGIAAGYAFVVEAANIDFEAARSVAGQRAE